MVLEADDLQRAAHEASGELETRPIGVPRCFEQVQQLPRPDHRLHPVLELGDDQRVQLLDQLRGPAGLAQSPFEHARRRPRPRCRPARACAAGVNSMPAALEQVPLGPRPDGLGVEQQAVVVEDDGVGERRSIAA